VDIAPEVYKPAERRSPHGFLDDRNAVAGNPGCLNTECGFRVAARRALGVPSTVVIEDGEMPSAVDIRPEVLVGHGLDAWHGLLS